MPDILILAGVALLVVFLVRKLVKDHKQGGCASCPQCSTCMKSKK
ncbi:FeoB-associated Cys-rich membrane protein [Kallipyga massiliensis]|nr:FeoB-associated Cys-rich membrane protein [Kallipyga massiliensis]